MGEYEDRPPFGNIQRNIPQPVQLFLFVAWRCTNTGFIHLTERVQYDIADLLLTAALDMCRELKLAFLSLEVRETNEPAISLYKKHGFETVGKRRDFYTAPKEDALIMTAYLNS